MGEDADIGFRLFDQIEGVANRVRGHGRVGLHHAREEVGAPDGVFGLLAVIAQVAGGAANHHIAVGGLRGHQRLLNQYGGLPSRIAVVLIGCKDTSPLNPLPVRDALVARERYIAGVASREGGFQTGVPR